jgi:predicted TIM-barrel fold metal-dependent hydrolase
VANTARPFVIALEEHYSDPDVASRAAPTGGHDTSGGRGGSRTALIPRLNDLSALRLKEMDSAGIDFQVISHVPSPIQQINAEDAVGLAVAANNRLNAAVREHQDRFAGFAMLPTPDPQAAADELERAVTRLGFKGAMIHGRSQGNYHDDKRYWPIFARAQALDVPIYLHPGPPHPDMVQAFYGDYLDEFPGLNSAAWGFTIDTANQALRLILSGLFDEYPRLKVILGHLGEGLPFLLDRIDEALKRPGNRGESGFSFRDTFCEHFYVTTSGFFSTPALLCTILEMGIDRVLFSVDWPFVENEPGVKWMENVPLSNEDKEKMYNGNAKKLLKL